MLLLNGNPAVVVVAIVEVMSNLIPEQRLDRNGKLVTRHVRSEGGASFSLPYVPAPKLSISGNDPSLIDGWRLVPSQTNKKQRTESGASAPYGTAPVFEASDVEVYSVLSVTSPATGLQLLADGVRIASEAIRRLTEEGREDELVDHSDMARQMLLRRVPAEFCIMGLERLSEEQRATSDPELLADYLEFFSIRSIMRKDSPKIADEVLSGEISLAHVREVGIDHLKTGGRLEIARPAFKELQKGTAEFTTDDLAHALYENRGAYEVRSHVDYMIKYGKSSLERLRNLGVGTFGGMKIGDLAARVTGEDEEAIDVIEYTSRLVDSSGLKPDTRSWGGMTELLEKGRFLHDAGVDVQYAAERIHAEEPREIAASFHDTHKAVGSGWL